MNDPLQLWDGIESVSKEIPEKLHMTYDEWVEKLQPYKYIKPNPEQTAVQKAEVKRVSRMKRKNKVMAVKNEPKARYFSNPDHSWGSSCVCIISLPMTGYLMTKHGITYTYDSSYDIEECFYNAANTPKKYKEVTQSQAIRLMTKEGQIKTKLFLKNLNIPIEAVEVISEENKNKVLELLRSKRATNPDSAFAVGNELLDICFALRDAEILKVPSWDDCSFYIES